MTDLSDVQDKWKELTEMQRFAVWAGGIAAAVVIWMFATFETRADSEEKWQYHIQGNQCVEVAKLRTQIDFLLLDYEQASTREEREAVAKKIDIFRARIKDLDPGGVCKVGGG